MEHILKNNLSDITYLSELILAVFHRRYSRKRQGLIRPNNLRSLSFRKLWAH